MINKHQLMLELMYGENATNSYELVQVYHYFYYFKKKRLENLESFLIDLVSYNQRLGKQLKKQKSNLIEVLYEKGSSIENKYDKNSRILTGHNVRGEEVLLNISKEDGRFSYSCSYVEKGAGKYKSTEINPLVQVFLLNEEKRHRYHTRKYKYNKLIENFIKKYLKAIFSSKLGNYEHIVKLDILGNRYVCKMYRKYSHWSLDCEILCNGAEFSEINLGTTEKIELTPAKKRQKRSVRNFNQNDIDSLYARYQLDKKQKQIDEKLKKYKEFNEVFEKIVERSVYGENCPSGLVYLLEEFKKIQSSI